MNSFSFYNHLSRQQSLFENAFDQEHSLTVEGIFNDFIFTTYR